MACTLHSRKPAKPHCAAAAMQSGSSTSKVAAANPCPWPSPVRALANLLSLRQPSGGAKPLEVALNEDRRPRNAEDAPRSNKQEGPRAIQQRKEKPIHCSGPTAEHNCPRTMVRGLFF